MTRHPESLSEHDVEALRQVGWPDAEILTATQIIGFFNYYARMADALGVEPEDFMVAGRPPEGEGEGGERR